MAYWRLYYHFVWATKGRQPFITAEVEDVLYRSLYSQGKKFHPPLMVVGGTTDHVHVLVALPPTVSPAAFAKQLKGASSWLMAQKLDLPFQWQSGYSVFSVSRQDVARVMQYVQQQKEHHAKGTLIQEWERTPQPSDK